MKRFHVHVGVADIDRSIDFYRALFGTEPTVRKPDYAKWMLDEPRINFAISKRDPTSVGVDHLGLQVDSDVELAEIRARFAAADETSIVDEPGAHCCYARGNKHWATDPQGVTWEAFHTLDSLALFSGTGDETRCCTGKAAANASEAAAAAKPSVCCA